MTPTTEQLKELVARLRASIPVGLEGDHTLYGQAADALSAIIAEREKAEPVGEVIDLQHKIANLENELAQYKSIDVYQELAEQDALIESLRANAERYLVLRNAMLANIHVRGEWSGYLGDFCRLSGEKLDMACDEARKGGV